MAMGLQKKRGWAIYQPVADAPRTTSLNQLGCPPPQAAAQLSSAGHGRGGWPKSLSLFSEILRAKFLTSESFQVSVHLPIVLSSQFHCQVHFPVSEHAASFEKHETAIGLPRREGPPCLWFSSF